MKKVASLEFKWEGEIISQTKTEEFVASRPALQDILRQFFRERENDVRNMDLLKKNENIRINEHKIQCLIFLSLNWTDNCVFKVIVAIM